VIVTCNPDHKLARLVNALKKQVGATVIVDNGSVNQALVGAQADQVRALVLLGHNRGLGHALNIGAAQAEALGFDWLLTFDQDSCPTPAMVSTMLAAHAAMLAAGEPVGAIGPAQVITPTAGDTLAAPAWALKDHLITSGMLLPVALYQQIGGYRADYFIDMLDFELCARLQLHGFTVVRVATAELVHEIGDPIYVRVLHKKLVSSNHSPLRRYFMVRNRLIFLRQYGVRAHHRVAAGMIFDALVALLIEQQRFKKLHAICCGTWHGLRGISGAPSAWLLSQLR
jgi:rhamnosyltransferase